MIDSASMNRTVSDWEREIGTAVRQLRIDAGYDQIKLADRANLSRSAIQSLEGGTGTRLHTLLAALRALDRLDAFDSIMPETAPTPMEVLAATQRSKTPQRHRKYGA